MDDALKISGMVVAMIIATVGGIYLAKTIEAAREQARRVQCKNTIVLGGPMRLPQLSADATMPENVR